jgi:hypothetical protein
MTGRYKGWPSAQIAASLLNLTSAEVCRLISIGRLSGVKVKQHGRAGKAQWLVDPKSIKKEQLYQKYRLAEMKRRQRLRSKAAA